MRTFAPENGVHISVSWIHDIDFVNSNFMNAERRFISNEVLIIPIDWTSIGITQKQHRTLISVEQNFIKVINIVYLCKIRSSLA